VSSDPNAPRILLGVGAGIAAYKSAELVRRMRDRGAEVRVVMTDSARHFVGEATFQALSGNPVRSSLWDASAEAAMGHIELARWADAIVIAPATADLIARLAHGHADDLLTTLCLASEAQLWLAPAMNRVMWNHPATGANVERLRQRGVNLLGPDQGEQACGEVGAGRMHEPERIAVAVFGALTATSMLSGWAGRNLLITAGPTFEDIDPVRFIGNRSSGKMGFSLAQAAAGAGADVVLVSGPVSLSTPVGVRRIDVRSARDMREAVMAEIANCDVFIAAAAVADFRPEHCAGDKLKKRDGDLRIDWVRNPDILAEVAALPDRPFVVGFAAETRDLLDNAREKLERKGLDLIAANHVGGQGAGFDCADNALTVLWGDGQLDIPLASKAEVARQLLKLMLERMGRSR